MAKKQEAVTVSFHYLQRMTDPNTTGKKLIPFTQSEFDNLYTRIKAIPPVDLKDEDTLEDLRNRNQAPLENCVKLNTQTIYGTFRASYTGHAYNNSALGKVPANSVSLRPFHFLLYLSQSGRIYIATQYLGQFGGYVVLKNTIVDLLPKPESIYPFSFRVGAAASGDIKAKEVRVQFSEKGSSIAQANKFTDQGVIAFKKVAKGDNFETQVASGLLSLFGGTKAEIKKGIAELMEDSALIDISDKEIEDCTIVAKVEGKRKIICMLKDSQFASRLDLNVHLDGDGHPDFVETQRAILKLLATEIIAKKEDA